MNHQQSPVNPWLVNPEFTEATIAALVERAKRHAAEHPAGCGSLDCRACAERLAR